MPRQRSPFSLYKRGGQYIARFWSDEQQKYTVSRATGATNKGQAGRIAQQILDRGDVVPRSRDPLLLDYLTEYWKAPARRVTERYRAESARFVSKIVSEWPEGSRLRLSRVDRAALYRLQAWVAQRTTPRYANRVLQAVRVPLAVAADRGQIAADPGFRFKGIDERTERRGALTFDEVRLLIAWDGPRREHAALLLGCLSGLRLGEIRALRWASVDLKNAIIRVTESYTDADGLAEPKANSRRLVMLHPALSPVLEDLRAESPYTEDEDFVLPQVERGRPIGYVTIRRALCQGTAGHRNRRCRAQGAQDKPARATAYVREPPETVPARFCGPVAGRARHGEAHSRQLLRPPGCGVRRVPEETARYVR